MNRLLTIVDTKYQRLEYLESSKTQYIDTGYYLQSNNLKVKIKFTYDFDNASERDFLGNQDNSTNRFAIGCYNHYIFAYSRNSSGQDTNTMTAIFSGEQTVEAEFIYDYDNSKKYITANGVTTSGNYARPISPSTRPLQFFGNGAGGATQFVGKIYYCQIYDNGTLVRNFVPILRKTDNELGMLDLVEGKFYQNAGTGKFTANLDTMYAIIQGSPTIQDGRVSNFSNSNYLQINQAIDFSKDVEIVLKTHTDTIRTTQYPMSWVNSQYYPSGLFVGYFNSANERYGINIRKESNTDEFVVAGSPNLQNDTDVWFKFLWDSTNKVVKYGESYDGVNYRFGINKTLTENFANAIKIIIGNFGGSNPFNGSIDLNRSYIKLGSTKYNLQAVVGYTVVGSPTISDGVVSGFSSANYLTINNALPTTVGNSYVFEGEVSTSSSSTTQYVFSFKCNKDSASTSFGFAFRGTGKFMIATTNGDSTTATEGSLSYQTNTNYKYRIETDLNSYARLYINDSLEISKTLSYTTIKPYNSIVYLGCYSNTVLPLTTGTMNISNTYIKVNNKLVFNGQQA